MKKLLLLPILFSLFYSLGYSNNSYIDSLKNIAYSSDNDSIRVTALNRLADYLINFNKDSALYYSYEALKISKNNVNLLIQSNKELGIIFFYKGNFPLAREFFRKSLHGAMDIKDLKKISNLYYLIGATYYYEDNYKSADIYYTKALKIALPNKFYETISNCYNALGITNKARGDYNNAIKYYLKSLKIAESLNDSEQLSNIYNNIGIIYKYQSLYEKALNFYKKALQTSKSNPNQLIQINNNIGNVYKELKEYEKALAYLTKALKIAKKINDIKGVSNTYLNISSIHIEEGKYKEAIKELEKALEIKKVIHDNSGIAICYNKLSDIYLNLSDSIPEKRKFFLEKAKQYALKAYETSLKIDSKPNQKTASYLLKEIYQRLNNYKLALKYSNIFEKLYEELYNKDKTRIINELEKRYDNEKNKIIIEKLKKERELRTQKIKNEELKTKIKQKQIRFLAIIIFIIFIVLIVILLNLRKIKKLNLELKKLNKRITQQYIETVKQQIEITNKNLKIEKQKEKIDEVVRQFNETIENLEDVYFKTDRYFRYKQVSPSILRHLEIDNYDKIIGKPLSEFWKISDKELKQLTYKILREKRLKDYMFTYKTTTGKEKYAKINARAIYKNNKFQGVEGIIHDITKEVQNTKQINELNLQKEILINNIPSAIYFKNNKLVYIDGNTHLAELYGIPLDEIIGKSDKDFALEDIREEFESLDKMVIKTKKPILNYINKQKATDGSIRWLSTSKIPYIDKNGEVLGIIGVVNDITAQVIHEKEMKESKEKIENAHKSLVDNIEYAKTIQQALLISEDKLKTYHENYFLIFKPRDQVSGDFYYVNKFNEYLIFAVGDCTGHGVSGSFITILAITYLHEIVNRKEMEDPAVALNLLRERFKKTFRSFGNENYNGLDIALCALNTKTNEMKYAGAFNPLWIVRNKQLLEYKATRNPIGFYPVETPFTSYDIKLQKEDVIYLFSDGYADQFGGKNNKKFTTKRFKQLLVEVSHLSMEEQKEILEQTFENWKGDYEQTDDVTVFGLKI